MHAEFGGRLPGKGPLIGTSPGSPPYLAAVAEQPDVAVHIVTDENTGTWGELDIASNGSLITVCMTTGLQDVTSTEPETIDQAVRAFDRVLGLALPCGQSLDFIRTREEQWKAQK